MTVAEVHRLRTCPRCRHLFVAGPGQRLCPDCLAAVRRDRARRSWRGGASQWRPLLIFAGATVAVGLVAATVYPAWITPAVWCTGILALIYLGR